MKQQRLARTGRLYDQKRSPLNCGDLFYCCIVQGRYRSGRTQCPLQIRGAVSKADEFRTGDRPVFDAFFHLECLGVYAAAVSVSYEQDRYEAGRSSVFDLINAQQKHLKTCQDAVQAKYEYYIRQRILDFYK